MDIYILTLSLRNDTSKTSDFFDHENLSVHWWSGWQIFIELGKDHYLTWKLRYKIDLSNQHIHLSWLTQMSKRSQQTMTSGSRSASKYTTHWQVTTSTFSVKLLVLKIFFAGCAVYLSIHCRQHELERSILVHWHTGFKIFHSNLSIELQSPPCIVIYSWK